MNFYKYSDAFLKMESGIAGIADNFIYNGSRLWQYLRNAYYHSYDALGFADSPFARADEKLSCEMPDFDIPEDAYQKLAGIGPGKVLIWDRWLLYSHKSEGMFYNPYLDQIYRECEKNGMHPLKLYMGMSRIKPSLYPVLQTPLVQTGSRTVCIEQVANDGFYKSYKDLCRESHVPVLLAAEIMSFYFKVEGYRKAIEKVLKIVRPSMVFCEAYFYTHSMLGLAHACKNLGIPCIEMQHSLQNWPHLGYCFPYMPENGWEIVPEWFFLWGQEAANDLQQWFAGQNYHKTVAAGQPLFSAWAKGDYQEDKVLVRKLEKLVSGRIPICVGLRLFQEEDRVQVLREMIDRSPDDWIWLVRKHPLEASNPEIEALAGLEDKIEYDLCSRINIHDVLKMCRHMVVGNSSSIYDGIALHNMRGTTITEYGKMCFQKCIDAGFMDYADNADDGLASIKKGVAGYPCPNYNYISSDASSLGKALRSFVREGNLADYA